jgi:cytidine deaminase
MKEKLEKLLKNSYGKYSNIKVSAIVVTTNLKEYKGVNVENSVFPSSICAERNAIFNAITNGTKSNEIKEIHIISNLENLLYPCGSCIQVMLEFCNNNSKIYVYSKKNVKKHTLKELIPYGITIESFG